MSVWRARSAVAARPRSVTTVVRGVSAGLRAARAAECALLFVAGALLAYGAALASGVERMDADAHAVALLCGCLCAVAWWLEHPVALDETAWALDRRLRHHGALATAFELEGRGAARRTAMEELVSLRVLERLRTGEAIRALFPPLFLPIAAPTTAALLLLLALEARRGPPPPAVDLFALADGLERALPLGVIESGEDGLGSAGEDGAWTRALARELVRVLEVRQALPRSSEEWARAPEGTRERLAELDRRLAELASRVAPRSELRGRLEEARAWVDALRMGLPPGGGVGGGTAGTSPRAESTPGSLTADVPEGTILRPLPEPEPPPMNVDPAASPSPSSAAEPGSRGQPLGLQAGNFWPSEYDAVVERWIELSRLARERAREQ
jgi:hypothetical protein